MELFREKKELPFEIHGFTQTELCRNFCEQHETAILVISEQDYEADAFQSANGCTVVLTEEKAFEKEHVIGIPKFQSAGSLYRQIIKVYADLAGDDLPTRTGTKTSALLGFYSPVRRCGQTSLALAMGRQLAQQGKTLYLNLETYAGWDGMQNMQSMRTEHLSAGRSMTDLLYFYSCSPEKLAYRLESMVYEEDGLQLVWPGEASPDYQGMGAQEWVGFFRELAGLQLYQNILLDLPEQLPGLPEVLQLCRRIYTMETEDRMAAAKLAQYEAMMQRAGQEEILKKTTRCRLPVRPGQELTGNLGAELTGYAGKILKQDGLLYGCTREAVTKRLPG